MGGLKKGVTANDMQPLIASASTFMDNFPGEKSTEICMKVIKEAANVSQYRSGEGPELTEEGSKKYKDLARDLAQQFKMKREENSLPRNSRARKLMDQMLKFFEERLDLMADGIAGGNNPELSNDEGEFLISTFVPQMNIKCFDKENLLKTEEYLRIFPLDKLLENANHLHDMNVEFHKNRNDRTLPENKAKLEEIRQEKNKFLPQVENLYNIASRALVGVSLEMEEVTTGLFGSRDYLLNQKTGFIGDRGLRAAANKLKREQLIEPAQISLLDQSMEKFHTSRAFIFKKESPEHKQMRESAEKVQKNLKILEKGKIYDEKVKGDRELTEAERADLMKKTYQDLLKLEDKTDQYIKHATPDGKEPRTSAGKARLAGAREMLEIAGMFKTNLVKDPAVKEFIQEQKAKAKAKAAEVQHKPSVRNRDPKAELDRIEDKFTNFSYLGGSYEGDAINAAGGGAYGLTNFEYMAAQMIATSAVKEAVMNGKIALGDAGNQISRETVKICKEEDFCNWIQNISKDDEAKKTLSEKNADGVRKDFTDALSKKLSDSDAEKTKDNTADKKKETVKKENNKENNKEAKKETKIKTSQKTKPEPTREVG